MTTRTIELDSARGTRCQGRLGLDQGKLVSGPARGSRARRKGATLVRINPREPQVPAGQISISGPAMATLQAIDAML